MGLSRRTDIHTMAVRLNFMARGLAHLVQVGMLARRQRTGASCYCANASISHDPKRQLKQSAIVRGLIEESAVITQITACGWSWLLPFLASERVKLRWTHPPPFALCAWRLLCRAPLVAISFIISRWRPVVLFSSLVFHLSSSKFNFTLLVEQIKMTPGTLLVVSVQFSSGDTS